jgi:hypothetical protein
MLLVLTPLAIMKIGMLEPWKMLEQTTTKVTIGQIVASSWPKGEFCRLPISLDLPDDNCAFTRRAEKIEPAPMGPKWP